MPQNIVDADSWTVTVEVAADGDPVNGASQVLIGQDLADRSLYTRNRTLGPVGGGLWHHAQLTETAGAINNFALSGPTVTFAWQQTANGGLADYYAVPLPTPPTGRITKLEVALAGNGAGGGPHLGLPAVLPGIGLVKQDYIISGNKNTGAGGVTDPSLDAASYDLPHLITLTGLTADLDLNTTYWALVSGEGGANSIANALYISDIRFYVEPAP